MKMDFYGRGLGDKCGYVIGVNMVRQISVVCDRCGYVVWVCDRGGYVIEVRRGGMGIWGDREKRGIERKEEARGRQISIGHLRIS